ncbi:hypothetical protein [Bradyrhizobium sp.]|jgi:hypothetical protein|uniref:hypothetical protein n=1 Tax=Bradyrhizobium sp. TaxID=376 RepID=UPI003C14747A
MLLPRAKDRIVLSFIGDFAATRAVNARLQDTAIFRSLEITAFLAPKFREPAAIRTIVQILFATLG